MVAQAKKRSFRCIPIRKSDLDRFRHGKETYFELAQAVNDETPFCLDIASGHNPFPQADVLCDLNAKPVPDRSMKKLVTKGKPFVMCSCYKLPFKDKAFKFVTSYYLIEHIDDPWGLYRELRRVSQHGYIQAPSWFNEMLYGEHVHKWIVLKRNGELYIKPLGSGEKARFILSFLFRRLYKMSRWQILHALLDETFHIFSVSHSF